jgi:hypothetical protein
MRDPRTLLAELFGNGMNEDDVMIFMTPPSALTKEVLERHEQLHREYRLMVAESPSNSVH